jgi:hypothetical protein
MRIDHIANRDQVLKGIFSELMGPSEKSFGPVGELVDFAASPFEDKPWTYKPNPDADPEEILRGENPVQRYGVGVLYPQQILKLEVEDASASGDESHPEPDQIDVDALEDSEVPPVRSADSHTSSAMSRGDEGGEESEFRIDDANKFQPSSMAISFLVNAEHSDKITVEFVGGAYESKEVQVIRPHVVEGDGSSSDETPKTRDQIWYLRRPVRLVSQFDLSSVGEISRGKISGFGVDPAGLEHINLQLECYVIPSRKLESNLRLITVVAINKSVCKKSSVFSSAVFQSSFRVSHTSKGPSLDNILPYPSVSSHDLVEEEEQISLLYRDLKTYAVGHGCSADWAEANEQGVSWVSAVPLPTFECPSTTHEIKYRDAEDEIVSVPEIEMNLLADPDRKAEAIEKLNAMVEHYEKWVGSMALGLESLEQLHKQTAIANLKKCSEAAERMKDGIAMLEDDKVYRAFQISNHAMLLQRSRSRLKIRQSENGRFGDYPAVKPLGEIERATWRPFQIAFILLALRSTLQKEDLNRETVELIWFPTGGGKTEAYLGLAAVASVHRRLVDKKDVGTTVLTRYTLRLLTQQQLLRASSLVCALEFLRSTAYLELIGDGKFTIGLWVGSGVTPSTRQEAKSIYNQIKKGKKYAGSILVLSRCPWCGAEMKVTFVSSEKGEVDGAGLYHGTVRYVCPDIGCFFNPDQNDFLPVEFIDEDLYTTRPTIVIGTIDKFATMHLDKARNARSMFGFSNPALNEAPKRILSAPSLVIQDELHLITGPLGSTAGLYEALIEELCTDDRSGKRIKPKIVCSTATIRGYREQIRGLYARQSASLFPPSGTSCDDSFFAQYARNEKGELLPGRMYVGVHPTGFTSGQTSRVRTFASLLQAPSDLVKDHSSCQRFPACGFLDGKSSCIQAETDFACRNAQDPWWTLLIYFNSLRDLGNAISLFQTDLPDYRRVMRRRRGAANATLRQAYQPMELTSRLSSNDIRKSLAALERPRNSNDGDAVNVCLASNIIEVGIDVDRLSLMSVVAQPKATSTYIQVTGRVGRNWKERPGLVVTIFAADRPRDRSHFERFRSYHECLYAQVEPTSVTPYTRPLLERAFHGVLAAYIRLLGTELQSHTPTPFPEHEYKKFVGILLRRSEASGMAEYHTDIQEVAKYRFNQWSQSSPVGWLGRNADYLLKNPSGNPMEEQSDSLPIPTPLSMRSVDATCQLKGSNEYHNLSRDVQEFSADYE